MNYRATDKLLSVALFADLLASVSAVWFISMAWWPWTTAYKGLALVFFCVRLVTHFSLGIGAITLLFLGHRFLYGVVPAYIGWVVLERFWSITPNGDRFLALSEELTAAIAEGASGATGFNGIESIAASRFPPSLVYLVYAFLLTYVVIARPRAVAQSASAA